MQLCRILLPEKSHDVVRACGGDLVDFTVTVLKAAGLGLEGLEFRDAEAPISPGTQLEQKWSS